jgi:hypothetical protein
MSTNETQDASVYVRPVCEFRMPAVPDQLESIIRCVIAPAHSGFPQSSRATRLILQGKGPLLIFFGREPLADLADRLERSLGFTALLGTWVFPDYMAPG